MSTRIATSPRTRQLSREDYPLIAAVVVQLVFIAVLPRVVTVDGPAHVAGGWVLAHLDDPVVRRFYLVDTGALPNLLTTLVLSVLVRLTGTDVSEQLLVAGYVVLLPVALRYALRGVHPQAGWLAVAAVPFTFNYLYYYGFYNFCLALALLLVVIGIALRQRSGWSAGPVALMAAVLVLTWSTHLLPAAVASVFVAVLAVVRTLAARRDGLAVAARRHLAGPVLAGLPLLVLTAVFLQSGAAERGAPLRRPLAELVIGLASLGKPLVVYTRWEILPAAVVTAALCAVAVTAWRRAGWSPARHTPEHLALAITGILSVLAYFASPDRWGDQYGFLNDRLSFFPPLLLALWAAGPPPARLFRGVAVTALLGSALAFQLLRLPTELKYQREVSEILSVGGSVPTGSVLARVQLAGSPPVDGPIRNHHRNLLRHETSRLAASRSGVDAGHYEAAQPYFPIRFAGDPTLREVLDPEGNGLEEIPPAVDLAAATPLVDAVIVIGRREAAPGDLDTPDARRVLADLTAGYRQVTVSEPTGLAEVWLRR